MGALWMQDIRQLFTRRRLFGAGICALFVLCVCFAVRRGGEQMDASERVAIGVINKDTSVYSQMLLSFYEDNDLFTSYVSIALGEEEDILALFEAGALDMYLVIPQDFADSMTYLEHLPVQAVISTRSPAVEIMLKNLMESYEKYISSVEIHCVALYDVMLLSGMPREKASEVNKKISVQLILKALSKGDFFEHYILENDSAIQLLPFYLHEAGILVLTFLALLAGVRFQKEHHAGIYARLNALGVGSFRILCEKLLFFGMQVSVAMAVAAFLLQAAGVVLSWEVYFIFWLYACLAGAVMLFMAAAFTKMKNYLLASNMFLLLGGVLGGGLIPFLYLPERMRTVAKCMPNYWFLRLIFDAEAGELTGKGFGLAAAACAVGILLLLLAATALHRRMQNLK